MSNELTPLEMPPLPAGPLRAQTNEHDPGSDDYHIDKAGKPSRLGAATPGLWLKVHQHLRGRYALAITLGILLGAASGIVGWKFQRPIYHSEGLVRIAYSLPEVMQRTDQNEPIAMFDTVMLSQRTLITSRRVVDAAVKDPIWKGTGRQAPIDPEAYFSANLHVDRKPRSEFIQIVVTDSDPVTAAAAVKSIINAYAELYTSQEKHQERQRIGLLEDRQNSIQVRLAQLNELLRLGAQEYGTTKLDPFYERTAMRLARLEEALADVSTAIATVRPKSTAGEGRVADLAESPAVLSVERIAVTDAAMRGYLDDQLRTQREVVRLAALGLGNSHKLMVTAKIAADESAARASRFAEMYREFHTISVENPGDRADRGAAAGKSLEALRADESRLTKIKDEVKQEMVAIGTKRATLDQESEELSSLQRELERVAKRVDMLQSESSLGGRLSVISTGEIPLSPDKDHRILITAGCGTLGAFLPAALLLLVSFMRQRYRYCADTESDVLSKHIPLLGIVPELSHVRSKADNMAIAAKSVHQIRMSLQTQAPSAGSSVYLVTSATPGEGKTSLTMALGISFAASRVRTLVIDGDLVGRSLTRNAGQVNEEGLHESVEEGGINGRIRTMEFGPSLLTAGKACAPDACTLSIQSLRSLLDKVRQDFDVILVDSGPILGSLEAAILAPLVDGVIVAISRGQEQHLLARAMLRLNALRANVVGCIFNRARQHDYENSQYASSTNVRGSGASLPSTSSEAIQHFSRFGPLVLSVAAGMPASWK